MCLSALDAARWRVWCITRLFLYCDSLLWSAECCGVRLMLCALLLLVFVYLCKSHIDIQHHSLVSPHRLSSSVGLLVLPLVGRYLWSRHFSTRSLKCINTDVFCFFRVKCSPLSLRRPRPTRAFDKLRGE